MSVIPAQLAPTPIPNGYRFVELTAKDDDRFTDAFAAGYELPRPLAAMFSPDAAARGGAPWRYFGAEQDEGGPLAAVSVCAVIGDRPPIACPGSPYESPCRALQVRVGAPWIGFKDVDQRKPGSRMP